LGSSPDNARRIQRSRCGRENAVNGLRQIFLGGINGASQEAHHADLPFSDSRWRDYWMFQRCGHAVAHANHAVGAAVNSGDQNRLRLRVNQRRRRACWLHGIFEIRLRAFQFIGDRLAKLDKSVQRLVFFASGIRTTAKDSRGMALRRLPPSMEASGDQIIVASFR